ncbi:hypothetical protein SSBR45G_05110 [Bradyrhizobium sp. SSBR45G]|uniref:hypothetical protein n=1 Tax=unclassified Bradyrhizobium TaxID=2631580 RepID=UPI002342969F|nr:MULTISPECIES: hypothetical protein [unclassified Bradyrhizobium]GLH75603.1 hypothetical protein SSBR45G_05110 [Bradyrhizobium sp. SSBR45G]GLH82607.1 hypothetical protein SSBR45R_00670 [Bradyrhizobium sp. SSBR45R]
MEKIIYDNTVSTFADDTQIVVVNAAGTSASTATAIYPPNNFRRVIFLVNRIDDSNNAVAFTAVATPGQEVEIHPVGGNIEVFATRIPTYNQNFLDGSSSFVTAQGTALRGVPNPGSLNAWSRLG